MMVHGLPPPVEFDDFFPGHSPVGQPGADTVRDDEQLCLVAQQPNGMPVEVIIVVVRDDHDVDRRKLICTDGHFAIETGRTEYRNTLLEHRIGHHPVPVDIDEQGGVPQPGGTQPTRTGMIEMGKVHRFYRPAWGDRCSKTTSSAPLR